MSHPVPSKTFEASHVAIYGATGSGKSYTARGLIEHLLDDERRVCILDPVGVWHGIRSNPTGDGPGYGVAIFGGEYADVDIAEKSGVALARMVAENNLPAVIDTSEMGVGERIRFLTDFLRELYRVNRKALWLVMEEADEAAPQRPGPEGARLLDACDTIARRGRSRGFRLIAVTQRPAVLHKNITTQCAALIAHRLPSPQDRAAVTDWIKGNGDMGIVKKIEGSLASLKTGQAIAYAPSHKFLKTVQMPMIRTLDSSRTPGVDEEPIRPTNLAEVDLSALALPEEEEPVKIGEAATTGVPRAEHQQAVQDAEQRGYARGLEEGKKIGAQAGREAVRTAVLAAIEASASAPVPAAPTEPRRTPAPVERSEQRDTAAPPLSPSAQKVLDVIAGVYPRVLSYAAAAKRAGLSKRSSAYRSYPMELLDAGLARETDRGLEIAGDAFKLAQPAPQSLEQWHQRLSPSQSAMLRALEKHGRLTRAALADLAGISPTSSGLGSGIRELVDLGLAVRTGDTISLHQDVDRPEASA